jgi:hypothetical protein
MKSIIAIGAGRADQADRVPVYNSTGKYKRSKNKPMHLLPSDSWKLYQKHSGKIIACWATYIKQYINMWKIESRPLSLMLYKNQIKIDQKH